MQILEKKTTMRMIFSLISLLIVVAIVGILAKKQLSSVTQLPAVTAPANVAEQGKQMQTQVQDQMNEALKGAAEVREKNLENGTTDAKTGSAY